jgi:hypothetical protein
MPNVRLKPKAPLPQRSFLLFCYVLHKEWEKLYSILSAVFEEMILGRKVHRL